MTSCLGLSRTAPKISLATLILLLTLTTSVFVYPDPQTTPYGDGDQPYPTTFDDGTYTLARELLSLLEASQAQVSAAINQLVSEGVVIPDSAKEFLKMADEVAAEAFYCWGIGDYLPVIEGASEAIQFYGEAIRIAMESEYTPKEGDSGFDLVLFELQERIERGESFLSDLLKTSSQMTTKGLDVSEANALLYRASEGLELAGSLLEEGDLEAAESELSEAEACLEEALRLLQIINDDAKSENVSKFLGKTGTRLDNLETRVSDIYGGEGLTSDNSTSIQEDLRAYIQALIESGDVNTAINELEKVTNYAGMVFEIIGDVDPVLADLLRQIEKLEAKKSSLEEKIEDFEVKGVDTYDLEEELRVIVEQLDLAIEKLQALNLGDVDGPEDPVGDPDVSSGTFVEEPEESPGEDEDVGDASPRDDAGTSEKGVKENNGKKPDSSAGGPKDEEADEEGTGEPAVGTEEGDDGSDGGEDRLNDKMEKWVDKWKSWRDNVKKNEPQGSEDNEGKGRGNGRGNDKNREDS